MLHPLGIILLWILGSLLLCAIIGFACKGRVATELVLTFIVTTGLYALLAWKDGLNRVNWSSFEDAYGAILIILGPFLYFIFVTAALVAFLVGRWRRAK